MFRVVREKTVTEITAEWDALASVRYRQINSGEDISYTQVIVPSLLKLLPKLTRGKVLDAGCGTGFFTSQLSAQFQHVFGVDPSEKSVEIAKTVAPRATLVRSTIEEFSSKSEDRFDLIVANMVLMDVLSLPSFLEGCARLATARAHLLFSITHPWFWPEYYGYANEPWFDYERQIIIESPFRISSEQAGAPISTHVHRSLSQYVEALKRTGFLISEILEPNPPSNVAEKYKLRWKRPRYLIGAARLVEKANP